MTFTGSGIGLGCGKFGVLAPDRPSSHLFLRAVRGSWWQPRTTGPEYTAIFAAPARAEDTTRGRFAGPQAQFNIQVHARCVTNPVNLRGQRTGDRRVDQEEFGARPVQSRRAAYLVVIRAASGPVAGTGWPVSREMRAGTSSVCAIFLSRRVIRRTPVSLE